MVEIPDVMIDEWARAKRVVIGGAGWIGTFLALGAFASGDSGYALLLGCGSGFALLKAANIKYRYRLKRGVAVYE